MFKASTSDIAISAANIERHFAEKAPHGYYNARGDSERRAVKNKIAKRRSANKAARKARNR